MKTGRLAGLLMLFAVGASSADPVIQPRHDINPALLYWQAFSLLPELDETESKLLARETAGDVNAEERALAGRFDAAFRCLVRARSMQAPCDWGVDLADGPNAFVPNVKKIRAVASAGMLRARVALIDGRQDQMREQLIAVSVMGRHTARGASLVCAMLQMSVDSRILDFVNAHFDRLQPQTRAELAAGLVGAPARTTVAEAMANERTAFYGWFLAKLEGFRAQASDDEKVLQQFRALTTATFSSDEKDVADKIVRAAGGTSAGVISYVKELEPHYQQLLAVAKASPSEIKRRATEFEASLNSTTNLMALMVLPNVGKARIKELEFEARLARLPNAAP